MIPDYTTKPLAGEKFHQFRQALRIFRPERMMKSRSCDSVAGVC